MNELYPGIPFSPQAELTDNVGEADTIIRVTDTSVFPAPPNYATIGDGEDGETILYTAKTADALSGCRRGMEGRAGSWSAGAPISRNFTALDHAALIAGIKEAARSAAANGVTFSDGSTFQQKCDDGTLTGPTGPRGPTSARFVIGTSAAGWTAADCDYLCDGTADDVEIKAAIQALPASGGEVLILDGTYDIKSEILLGKPRVSLRGSGAGTVLKRNFTGSSNEPCGAIRTTAEFCSVSCLAIDGNNSAYTGTFLCGLVLGTEGCAAHSLTVFSSVNGIAITGQKCSIEGCILSENRTGAIIYHGSDDIVTGNVIIDSTSNGLSIITAYRCLVECNLIIKGNGTASDYGDSSNSISLSGGSGSLITSNLILGKNYVSSGGTGNSFVNNKFE